MKKGFHWAKMLVLFSQLGISVVVPPILMALLGIYLQRRFAFGWWATVVCLVLGLIAGISGGIQICRKLLHTPEEEKKHISTAYYSEHQ